MNSAHRINASAQSLVIGLEQYEPAWRIACHAVAGARVIDMGVDAVGSLEAGLHLARVCMAGLGEVSLVPGDGGPSVAVRTDQPVIACMAAQYAGWQIALDGYFAMGSGPMRAAAAKEDLFEQLDCMDRGATYAVGVLETGQLPTAEVCHSIAAQCSVPLQNVTLFAARTASLAGTVQIIARSVETAMHKLHELGFDLHRVQSGFGTAPLPPVAAEDLTGIGRTNDAILYGGEVTLWVTGDDERLRQIGPNVPSCSSPDHGAPFAEIFERYNRDFYEIDPRLFSPAVITLVNLDTGRAFRFGQLLPEVLQRSFAIETG